MTMLGTVPYKAKTIGLLKRGSYRIRTRRAIYDPCSIIFRDARTITVEFTTTQFRKGVCKKKRHQERIPIKQIDNARRYQ